MSFLIEKIFIEESVSQHPLTKKALEAQARAQGPLPRPTIIPEKEKITGSKETLILRKSRGEIFHTCPGTKEAVCCNYFVFDFLSGCPFNCSYCYLQAYLNEGGLNLKVNLEDPVGELITKARTEKSHLFRIGTGELADSLALPASDPMNEYLIETLSQEANIQLELKTKSDRVENLLPLDSKGRVVISWSLSPSRISDSEEHGTAAVGKRLAAAKKVVEAGYQVAFHLDPLLWAHETMAQWQNDYRELLETLFAIVPREKIAWISTGGLRLIKNLRDIMIEEFPKSALPYAEMVMGRDGKLRYPKNLRKEMFAFIQEEIFRLTAPKNPPLYLCMEARDTWNGALGGTPVMGDNLRKLFSRAIPREISLISP